MNVEESRWDMGREECIRTLLLVQLASVHVCYRLFYHHSTLSNIQITSLTVIGCL